jgi:phosphate transport system permease protein
VAVTALEPADAPVRDVGPLPAVVFAACAAVLCLSVVAIVGWLAVTGLTSGTRVLNPFDPAGVLRPLLATVYVTALALPLAAVVGVFAAIGAADTRIFGSAAIGMRGALGLMGSVPTVVVAFSAAVCAVAVGWRPTLTGAALLLAVINMPLMTSLALSVLTRRSADIRDAATAVGATPMFLVRHVLLPRAMSGLWGAVMIVGTQIIGAAGAIAIIAGANVPNSTGEAPINAWPLAVHVWIRASAAGGYGATAAGALLLAALIWLLQGIAQLRSNPDAAEPQEGR